MAATFKTEAVVLRSLRFGEADRVLHVYTLAGGRLGAIAKGVRKTRSRFGGRLEPLSHVELVLHQGRGELATVTGADLVRSHAAVRDDPYRLGVGLVGAEAMLRLFHEQEANRRGFEALTRFLDLLEDVPLAAAERSRLDPLGLSFQLKLLWLAGYLPHLGSCAECGGEEPFVGFSARAGVRGAVALVGRRDCARRPAPDAPGGGGQRGLGRPRGARGVGRSHGLVRVPRRLQAADALGLKAAQSMPKYVGTS
jgi:DNA repair protein RecO (recombination protein O)